jgi:hypothetical protein
LIDLRLHANTAIAADKIPHNKTNNEIVFTCMAFPVGRPNSAFMFDRCGYHGLPGRNFRIFERISSPKRLGYLRGGILDLMGTRIMPKMAKGFEWRARPAGAGFFRSETFLIFSQTALQS